MSEKNDTFTDTEKKLLAQAKELYEQGNYAPASLLCQQILENNPEVIAAHTTLGLIFRQTGQLQQAISCFDNALKYAPNDPNLYYHLGLLFMFIRNDSQAESMFQQSVALNPQQVQSLFYLGALYQKKERWEKALACYESAVKIQPSFVDGHVFQGSIYRRQKRFSQAIQSFLTAIKIEPDNPDHHVNLSDILLRTGSLFDGFKEYEWRIEQNTRAKTLLPLDSLTRWQGELFTNKKLLVYYEQGFGDTLQFIRYFPLVKQRGGYVTFVCQPALLRLLQNCPGVDSLTSNVNMHEYDLAVPLMSLPNIFGTTLRTIPAPSLLHMPPHILQKCKKCIPDTNSLKVGIVWSVNLQTMPERSCRLTDLAPLAHVNNAEFFSLQTGEARQELSSPPPGLRIHNLAEYLVDFADTAGFIMNLDLIISIDTATAHLAGALNRPTWITLPHYNEWRWLIDRDDTPWYPSLRIFRCKETDTWSALFERIATELKTHRI